MTQTNRFWKFVWFSLSGILVSVSGLLSYLWFHLFPSERQVLFTISQDHIYILLCLVFIVVGALWVVFDITYNRYILPLKRMSAEAGMIYDSNPSHRIRVKGSRDIVQMARVINDFADMFENLNKTITQQILVARQETEKERNLLAAIMGELPHGIVVCNINGRILLFNSLAKELFRPKDKSGSQELFLGLGRSIFHLLDKSLVAHAMDEIIEQVNTPNTPVGSSFISPVASGGLISAEAIPVMDIDKRITGFILAVQDISLGIEKYQTVDRYLNGFQTRLLESLGEKNGEGMAQVFERTAQGIRDTIFSSLPLTALPLDSFLAVIQKKSGFLHNIRVNIFNPHPHTRMLADSYSMTLALVSIIRQMSEHAGMDEFDIRVSLVNDLIEFKLTWEGPHSGCQGIPDMVRTRLDGLPSLGYVLKFNNARLNFARSDNGYCTGATLSIRTGNTLGLKAKKTRPVISDARPEFYDFDLFSLKEPSGDLLDLPLKKISYTVFDTETTGLNPEGGDEIISIGAVRIVNSRLVYQDIFEELVNPERDIPMESYKIHGINYEMVKDKAPISKILPIFRQFAANTVLLGHNLAFDMKMLKVKESVTKIRFDNPVLDTLLLSAMLHPVHRQHDIESIAKRLGVNVMGRHTALGDAITTAEIFLKLLPILNSNGILTLKDAIKASKKTYYARLKY